MDWLNVEYPKRTGGKIFRDPDRQIRNLHQEGHLIKVKTGVYRYDPSPKKRLPDFNTWQRRAILKRDGYKCVICGKGEKDGVNLQIDHIKPRDKGGEPTIDNGQTLCAAHNFKKKNYNQTETAKKLFIRLYERSINKNDTKLANFCKDILAIYDKHDIDRHIEWDQS